jgi:hypothetical protein
MFKSHEIILLAVMATCIVKNRRKMIVGKGMASAKG